MDLIDKMSNEYDQINYIHKINQMNGIVKSIKFMKTNKFFEKQSHL